MTDDLQDAPALEPKPSPIESRLDAKRLRAVAIILLVAFVGLAALYYALTYQDTSTFQLGTIVLLLGGLAVVTLVLYLGMVLVRALDLAAPNEAMGMPPGSIRAMIAVSLILLFAIVGFVVFNTATQGGHPGTSHSIGQSQIDKMRLDGATVVSQSLVNPGASPGLELYDVETVSGLGPDAHDFGLQLLSTTITLVVAVAGFYFGAQTVNQAGKETREQLGLIQAARAARRAEIIGAVPDPPDTVPEDAGDGEPPTTDADSVDGGADPGAGADPNANADPNAAGNAGPNADPNANAGDGGNPPAGAPPQ